MGTSEVPVSPQRVVVLDTAPLDAALALGVKPVGTLVYGQSPDYLGDRVEGIDIIGDGNQPNLEAILNLQPDLILGSKIGAEELYNQLSQIAPTVLTEGSGRAGDWPENLQLYAEALGKSAAAEQLLKDYRQRVQQLQAAIAQPQALEISVLIVPSDIVRAFTAGSFSGSVLQDIGLSRPPAQDDPEGYASRLSAESLDALDGDYIFLIYSTYRPGGTSKAAFVRHPIWSQLQAVQQDRVCEVDGAVWIAGRNILAANQILTDVEACLD
ncbi:MAG: iron-siderophore ABC transporter substrate-binding protein [Leptolyngbya sp. SIOISBB]|nr:iron-siderophore ABC transporter substrate-binding protein [Leptolyngbya sp. SIOISBB]